MYLISCIYAYIEIFTTHTQTKKYVNITFKNNKRLNTSVDKIEIKQLIN